MNIECRRLGNVNRFQGRVLPYFDSSIIPEVSTICNREQSVSVQSVTNGSKIFSKSVHEGDKVCQRLPTAERYRSTPIFGRLADSGEKCETSRGKYKDSIKISGGFRFCNQPREIRAETYTTDSVFGRQLCTTRGNSTTDRRENYQVAGQFTQVLDQDSTHSESVATRDWPTGSDGEVSTRRTIKDLTTAVRVSEAVDTRNSRSELFSESHTRSESSSGMVESAEQCKQRYTVEQLKRDRADFHRCIPARLGWSYGKFRDQRNLESRGTVFTHKCTGVESSTQDSTAVQKVPTTQGGFSGNGQHNSSGIHSKTGWNEVETTISDVTGAVSVSGEQRHGDQGQTCSRKIERVGRRIITVKRDSKHRMVIAPSDFGDLEVDRTANDQLICDEAQQQDADVCVSNTGRESLESGCFVHKLERPLCVCVSSDTVNRTSVEKNSAIQVSDSVNSTNVAKTSVVSTATGVIDRETNKITSVEIDVETTEVIDKTRESTDAQLTCGDLIKRRWKEKGFSEAAANRMARAQKESSRAVYQGKWRIFVDWCEQQKVDPLQFSLIEVADFLVYLHEEKKTSKVYD